MKAHSVASLRVEHYAFLHAVGEKIHRGAYVDRDILAVGRQGGGNEHIYGILGAYLYIVELTSAEPVHVEAETLRIVASESDGAYGYGFGRPVVDGEAVGGRAFFREHGAHVQCVHTHERSVGRRCAEAVFDAACRSGGQQYKESV